MSKKYKSSKNSGRKHKRLSTDIVVKYLSQREEPANTKNIAETLGRAGKEGRDETFKILEQLRDEGKVKQLSKHRWAMQHAIHEHRGRVVGHVDGHGYVLSDETKEKIFLRSQDMQEILHNDIVDIRVSGRDRRNRLFGQIIDVVERGNTTLVGRYFKEDSISFVVPDDQRIGQDISVMPEYTAGAKEGQVVLVKITKPPSRNFQPVGEIVEVLGDYLAPGMEIEIALRKHQLPHLWPADVERQSLGFTQEPGDKDLANSKRKDIRDLPLVTIDGEDARDFDDAVYCQPLDDGRSRLIVAIADVSSYVTVDSPLDREAFQRGNSVYFPNNVIPMLPEVLSNGLCSLKPEVDRLCFVCDMHVNADGEIESYDFYQAIMHSHARLTYTQVAALIDGDIEQSNIASELQPAILDLYRLSQRLGQQRRLNGTIEFEIPEPVIIFDEQRKIDRIVARSRNDAHRLIEECMLAANICASLILADSNLVGIYRVHEAPDTEKIADVRTFLRQFKLLLGGKEEPTPKHFSEVLANVDDPLVSKIAQMALLRSMKQARYSIENEGHFALNFDSYTHFTSPIRRYADLLVHRQIRRLLDDPEHSDSDEKMLQMEQIAEQTSMTERRAESATRQVMQWLKCEFMSHKLGEKLPGTVSAVTEFGLFVELNEFYVDGLVHITSLGQDYYRYDSERRLLEGESTGRIYQVGQHLEVQVARVDIEQGRIDFSLPEVRDEKINNKHKKKTKNHSAKPSGNSKHKNKPSSKKRSNRSSKNNPKNNTKRK